VAAPISIEEPREGECIVILLPIAVGGGQANNHRERGKRGREFYICNRI
jgi:hypothetical protein